MEGHDVSVISIAAQVRRFHDAGIAFRIYHGSTNSTRSVKRDPTTSIDISKLNNILCIDKARGVAVVEPNVPMDALLRATLEYGLVPPVIPEFPGITVGGGFAGGAGESSSFKYGFLDATVEKVEVILANGTVREAGADGDEDEAELFRALSGTLGTIGVLTRLDIRLTEAQAFVELTYQPVFTFAEAKATTEDAMQKTAGNDFVDGIMFSPTRGAIVTGRMVSETYDAEITHFSRPTDEWFFLHAEEMVTKSIQCAASAISEKMPLTDSHKSDTSTIVPAVDFVPLTDYLFRYDRGAFWMGKYGCKHFLLPFTKTTRTLLDPLFHTREMYTALHASKLHQHHIVEDLAVPIDQTVPFLDYLDQDFGIYPLWLCPLKSTSSGLTVKHLPRQPSILLNVGVWGPWDKKYTSFQSANRALEAKVRELGGQKWLYAQCFYNEEEFWQIYDREEYEGLRRRYKAESLPNVFEKVRQKEMRRSVIEALWDVVFGFWLVGGLWGLWQAWRRANYVLKR